MEPRVVDDRAYLRVLKSELTDVKGNLVEDGKDKDLKKFTVPIWYEGEQVNATAYVDADSVKPCHVKAKDEMGNVIMKDGVPEIAVDREHAVISLGNPDNNIQLTLPDGIDKKGYYQTKTVSMPVGQFAKSIAEANLRESLMEAAKSEHTDAKDVINMYEQLEQHAGNTTRDLPQVSESENENDGESLGV